MWLYTLNLNLSKESNSDFGFKEIFGDLGEVLNDLPKFPEVSTSTPTVTDEFLDELADKLQDIETLKH